MSNCEVLLCTGGYDHTIRLWNVVQGNCTAVLQHNESQINALAIAPDRSLLAAAGNPCIRIYDPHHSPLSSTAGRSSSSNSVTASTALYTLNIRGADEEEQRVNVLDVAFYDHNVVIAGAEDGTVRLWDLRCGNNNCISNVQLNSKPISIFLQTEEMRVWYGDSKGRIYAWDLSANKPFFERSIPLAAEISAITAIAGAKTILCGDYDGRVWSLCGDQLSEKLIHTHQGHVTFLGSSPDGKYFVSTSADRTAQIYKTEDDLLVCGTCLQDHTKWVWDATFSADSMYLLTASTDCSARLWEVETGDQVSIFTGQHTKGITCVAMNDFSY